jgi:hypothetical protein
MIRRAVLVANAVAALVTIAFSSAVLADPGIGLPVGVEVTPGAALYAQATALRSLALAAVLAVVLAMARTQLVPLLVVAGLTQSGDAVLHLAYGAPGAAVCALVLAAVPFGALRTARGIRQDVRNVDVGA